MMRFLAIAVALTTLTACQVQPAAPRRDRRLDEIVYVNPLPQSQLWQRFGECIADEGAKHGIKVRTVGARGSDVNVQSMQNLVSEAIATHADAIVTWSNLGSAGFDALFTKQRERAGLSATLLSQGASHEQNFDVSGDVHQALLAVLDDAAKLPGHRYVGAIVADPADMKTKGYALAIREGIRRHKGKLTMVDVKFDHGQFSQLGSIVNVLLTAHPEINTIFNYSGHPAIWSAVADRRMTHPVKVYTSPGDAPQAVLPYIDTGIVGGLMVRDHCGMGRTVVRSLQRAWVGKPVKQQILVDARIVSPGRFRRLVESGNFP